MASNNERITARGDVPDLPVFAYIPPRPRIPKIELEAAFLNDMAVRPNDDGKPDWDWFQHENGLCNEHVDACKPRLYDFETTRMDAMKQNDVQLCINAVCDPGIQSFKTAEDGMDRARKLNDFLHENCQKSGGRFNGWCVVSLLDCEGAAREIKRCVKELGFVGVLINGFQDTEDDGRIIYLDDPSCAPIWETIVELDCPMYIHPRASHKGPQYEGFPEMRGAMWGFAPETGTHLIRLVYGGIFDKYPTVRVAVGHMGETIPYMAWRIQHYFEMNNWGRSTKLTLQDYLNRNIWITTSGNHNTQALQLCLSVMGEDRIMWSVDYPFENVRSAADWIENAPISETARKKICYQNAIKFLGLKDFKPQTEW